MSRLQARAWSAIAGLVLASSLHGQTVTAGGEFQVNAYTTGTQNSPVVRLDSTGGFIVVWGSAQDGDNSGIFARRFDASGVALGVEFQVNTYTVASQRSPSVATNLAGDFVVAWQGFDGGGYGIFARSFFMNGTQTEEFQVNTYTTNGQTFPSISIDSEGDFVVTWTSFLQPGYGAFARMFNIAGTPKTPEIQVGAIQDAQTRPSVALDYDGDFVIAWQKLQANGYHDVYGRRFDYDGVPLASEFRVNIHTPGAQQAPSVAMNDDGKFIVTWQSSQDGSGLSVLARRFASNGEALGGEIQINAFFTGDQLAPEVGIDGTGNFVVAWASEDQDGTYRGLFARRFDSAGTAQAAEFQASTYTLASQEAATVGMSARGDFVIAWQSFGQDGSSDGIFAQRYHRLAVLDIDGNGSTAALSDGVLVLRFLFGFTGTPLVSGAFDAVKCTRCDAGAIASYLNTLI